ncbi:hypothetical protein Gotur_007074 [Gossypium turneri]
MVRSMKLVLEVEDRLSWVHDSNGEFTKLKVPPRVQSFLWMLAIDRFLQRKFLLKERCSFNTFWSNVHCVKENPKKFMVVIDFGSLLVNYLNFNVYGIANEEVAGCGGVLRDMEGVARVLFSGPIAANDADSVEVGVVFIALDLFLSMGWKINSSLIIEISSKMVYNWCLNKDMRPWLLPTTFSDIERKIEVDGIDIAHMWCAGWSKWCSDGWGGFLTRYIRYASKYMFVYVSIEVLAI